MEKIAPSQLLWLERTEAQKPGLLPLACNRDNTGWAALCLTASSGVTIWARPQGWLGPHYSPVQSSESCDRLAWSKRHSLIPKSLRSKETRQNMGKRSLITDVQRDCASCLWSHRKFAAQLGTEPAFPNPSAVPNFLLLQQALWWTV